MGVRFMEQLVGKRLGKYYVLDKIDRGAMGVVYKALDLDLQRLVAIKVLDPRLSWDSAFVERFLREARVAARLNHPNIVAIYDVGQEQGQYFFAMQYLEGISLERYLRQRGPLSGSETVDILIQVASALDYAHQQGVVHRDVKPANIIFQSDGKVVLTDFGIVKVLSEGQQTATGMPVGTLPYMSPEQIVGGSVSAATDCYALAVLAYRMLSGRVPYEAEDTGALLYQIVHTPVPSIRNLRPELPEAVQRVLQVGMAKRPEDRYPCAVAFVEALKQALAERATPRRPAWQQLRAGYVTLAGEIGKLVTRWSAWLRRLHIPAWAIAAAFALLLLILLVRHLGPPSSSPGPADNRSDSPVPRTAASPSPTPLPFTPTPVTPVSTQPPAAVARRDVNLREGPGTQYRVVGKLQAGQQVMVVAWAQSSQGDRWLLVRPPGWADLAWVYASYLDENAASSNVGLAQTVPPVPRTPTPTPIPEFQVRVVAWQEWQDSGIHVPAGWNVRIEASGAWTHLAGRVPMYGPGGSNEPTSARLRLPYQPVGILLARVGSGSVRVVGATSTWRSGEGGNLSFCMNDIPGEYGNNSGEVLVRVVIWP